MMDWNEMKHYDYDFTQTVHSAKVIKRLRVFVYFRDEKCVVIEPLVEGEGFLEKARFYYYSDVP